MPSVGLLRSDALRLRALEAKVDKLFKKTQDSEGRNWAIGNVDRPTNQPTSEPANRPTPTSPTQPNLIQP